MPQSLLHDVSFRSVPQKLQRLLIARRRGDDSKKEMAATVHTSQLVFNRFFLPSNPRCVARAATHRLQMHYCLDAARHIAL